MRPTTTSPVAAIMHIFLVLNTFVGRALDLTYHYGGLIFKGPAIV